MRCTTPVTRLLVMQISSGMSRSRRWRISAGSSHAAAMPCPMRSAPSSSASQIDSGPMLSPACACRCSPALLREREDFLEPLGRTALFAAADAERHHALRPRARRPVRPPASPAPRRTAGRHPESSAPRTGESAGRRADGIEDRRELLLLPEHHARRDNDLRVAHVLRGQALQQAARDQRIVLGRAQALADRAEGSQESVEIGVMIERAILLDGRRGVELVQRLRLHRAFQVEMQFGFGHFEQEIVHT